LNIGARLSPRREIGDERGGAIVERALERCTRAMTDANAFDRVVHF